MNNKNESFAMDCGESNVPLEFREVEDFSMTQHANELLANALLLPDDERAVFTEQLLASFDPQPGELVHLDDDEFLAELDRRAEEFRNDPTTGVPWDIVKDMR